MSDLDALFMASARLTLNSAVPAVKRMIQGSPDQDVRQLKRVLHWDITRQMVVMALENEDVVHSEFDPEATSIGSVLRNLISTHLAGGQSGGPSGTGGERTLPGSRSGSKAGAASSMNNEARYLYPRLGHQAAVRLMDERMPLPLDELVKLGALDHPEAAPAATGGSRSQAQRD